MRACARRAARPCASVTRPAPAKRASTVREIARWLTVVGRDPEWASKSRPVASLSGEQAQRLAVARALASGRKVLVLDESSVGLDPSRVIELVQVLRALCDTQAASVINVTHDPTFAALKLLWGRADIQKLA